MKNLVLTSTVLAALVLTACDSGSAVTECSTDADCPAEQPVCDTSSDPGVCVPEDSSDPECEEDLDCQLANGDSATTQEDCAGNDDCDAGDNCVEDQLDVTYCVTTANNQGECDAIGGTYTTLTDIDGGSFGGCLADGACSEDGACE